MGFHEYPWQNRQDVLLFFNNNENTAIKTYQTYVAQGIKSGRRNDLIGGGLLRSVGGWTGIKTMRKQAVHMKSDARILGDGDFVAQVWKQADENYQRSFLLKGRGVDLDFISKRVSRLMDIPEKEILSPGRDRKLVKARSLLCYWAVRELDITMTEMAQRLNISTAAVSKAVTRGGKLAGEKSHELIKFKS